MQNKHSAEKKRIAKMASRKSKKVEVDYRNLERDTIRNTLYRKVVHTVPGHMQLVLMSLKPGETIPWETHDDVVQFVRVEAGEGVCIVGRKQQREEYQLTDGTSLIIPNGTPHYFENTAQRRYLKLYTIYTPPEHAPNVEQSRQP